MKGGSVARTFLAGEAAVRLTPNAGNFHNQARADLKKGGAINCPVSLIADATGFRGDARARLDRGPKIEHKVQLVADATGFKTKAQAVIDTGRQLHAKVKLQVDRGNMSTEIAQIKTDLAAVNFRIRVGVDLDTAGARAELATLTRNRTIKIDARVDNSINIDNSITQIFNDIDNQVTNVNGGLGKMTKLARPAMYAMLGLAAVDMIPLVSVLAKAAGVLALLPALGAAAGAGLGTLLLGTSGIADAFKAFDKVQANDPVKATQSLANGQRKIADSEKALTRAHRDQSKALGNLNEERRLAVRRLRDMNDELDMSAYDEESAAIAIEEAKKTLRDVYLNGGDALDERRARNDLNIAYEQYDQILKKNDDLKNDVAAANKAGIEGDAGVVAAKEDVQSAIERVGDAQQNVIEAQEDFNTKIDESVVKVNELDEAMAKLSPNAQDFVRKVQSLSSEWTKLKILVQDNLFDGLGDGVVSLATTYMPILTTGFGNIATTINTSLLGFFDRLQTEGAQDNFRKIFENANLFIGPLIDGIGLMLEGLGNIAAVGSEFLPGIGQDFKDLMTRFVEWSGSEEGKNDIRQFIKDALDAFGQVKDLFLAIGRVIGGIFKSSETTGKSMMESLTENLNKFADWMDKNPDKMSQFWTDVRNTVNDIIKMIEVAISLADKIKQIVDKVYNPDGLGPAALGGAGNLLDGDPVGAAKSFGSLGGQGWSKIGGAVGMPTLGPVTGWGIDKGKQYAGNVWNWGKSLFGSGAEEFNNRRYGTGGTGGAGIGGIGGRGRAGGQMTEEEFNAMLEQRTGEDGTGNFLLDLPVIKDNFDRAKEMFADLKESGVLSWDGLSTKIGDVIDDITGGKFTQLKTGLTQLGKDILGTTDDGQINWGNLGTKFGTVVVDIVDRVFPGFKTGLQGVKDFASAIVAGFQGDWSLLKGYAADPINWVIEHVINGALKSAWNTVAKVLGLDEWEGVAPIDIGQANDAARGGGFGKDLAGMWTGGVVPGYTPGRDPYVMGVSGGEGVIRPEATRALGAGWIDGINNAARRDGVAGAQRFAGNYANGGVVQGGAFITSPIQQAMWDAVRTAFPQASLNSGTRTEDVGSGYDLHMQEKAIDLGGPMPEIANWIYGMNSKQPVAELIHWPLQGWQNLDNGVPFDFGPSTNAQHEDHVHWGMDSIVNSDGRLVFAGGGSLLDAAGRAMSSGFGAARSAAATGLRSAISALSGQIPTGDSMISQVPKAFFDKITGAMLSKIAGSSGMSGMTGNSPWDIGAGAEQWRPLVEKLFKEKGIDLSMVDKYLYQIHRESSGDPNAINLGDDNAKKGTPSKGLAQVIDPTFQSYKDAGFDNIWAPEDNLRASLNYLLRDPKFGGQGVAALTGAGYDKGGIANGIGMMPKMTLEPERVLDPIQTKAFEAMLPFLVKLWGVKESNDPFAVDVQRLNGKDFPTTADLNGHPNAIEGSIYGQNLQGAAVDPLTGEYLPENNTGTPGTKVIPTAPLPPAFSTTPEGRTAMSLAGMGGELGFGKQAAKIQSKEGAVMELMSGISGAAAAAAAGPEAFAAHVMQTQASAVANIGKNFAEYLPEAAGGMAESAFSALLGPFAGATINTGMSRAEVVEISEDGMNRQKRRANPRRR
jgi:hypothetical protein